MTLEKAQADTIRQFTVFNQTGINCVNKGATTMDSFKEDVYNWMSENIPPEMHDDCYQLLVDSAWNYDILKPLIYDDGAISDIACHSWDNVWIQTRGVWSKWDKHFRDEEHYNRFFNHVCIMNDVVINARNASDNRTDINTCPNFRMRLNFLDKSINTNGNYALGIRKISTKKKTLDVLARPEEGMITEDMIPIIEDHVKNARGILIVGMGGSGKTTFLNALLEIMDPQIKILVIQENEELFKENGNNIDFLKTVKGINKYDASHDLRELARNGLLMSIGAFIIGETKGTEAIDLLTCTNTGAIGVTTAHAPSAAEGLDTLARYIKMGSDYSLDQCMHMLTNLDRVFFLEKYRVREISVIQKYDFDKHQLIMDTQYYNPNPK